MKQILAADEWRITTQTEEGWRPSTASVALAAL
jgi:hypothetical protein